MNREGQRTHLTLSEHRCTGPCHPAGRFAVATVGETPLDQRSGRRRALSRGPCDPSEAHHHHCWPKDHHCWPRDHRRASQQSGLRGAALPSHRVLPSAGQSSLGERGAVALGSRQGTCLRLDQHCHPNFVGLGWKREWEGGTPRTVSLLHTWRFQCLECEIKGLVSSCLDYASCKHLVRNLGLKRRLLISHRQVTFMGHTAFPS